MSRSAALAQALPDFGRIEHLVFDAPPPAVQQGPVVPEQPPVEEIVAAAVLRARTELADALAAEHETALQAERERHAAELETVTAQLGAQAGALCSARLQELEDRVAELTTAVTARILANALADDLRKRAIERLDAAIREALSDGEAVRIRVRGAPSLCQALEKALGKHAGQVTFSPTDGFDISVAVDDTVYETRLSEWSATIAETLQ